jgi:hypothetical protein
MRGQKIFNQIIKEEGIAATRCKGRNNSLIARRNECLLARYYYYGHMKKKSYEDILRLLMAEFYVSPSTISYVVQEHVDELRALKGKCPTLYYFNNRWPHIKW